MAVGQCSHRLLQVIAKRRVKLLRIQHQKQKEADRLRREEEERLKKEQHLKASEARKEAERRYKERLALIEQEKYEELEKMRMEASKKREEIEELEEKAERRKTMPIDDSKIVEQMFGFLPEGEQAHLGDVEPGKYTIVLEHDGHRTVM